MTDIRFDRIDLQMIEASGQCFRWHQTAPDCYLVMNGASAVHVRQVNDKRIEVLGSWGEAADWETYFDASRDYQSIDQDLKTAYPHMLPIIDYGNGMRLLKQDHLETLVTFMMSANNHIPRIKGFINRLCHLYGEKIGALVENIDANIDANIDDTTNLDIFSFPTLEMLATISEAEFKRLGAGYRSAYLFDTFQRLSCDQSFATWHLLDTESLIAQLMTLKGIGIKVAECIALYGYGRWDCFPIDTWIKKASTDLLQIDFKNDKELKQILYQLFAHNRGLVQQYLFYYRREVGGSVK